MKHMASHCQYRPINPCWGFGQQVDNSHSTIQKLSTLYCDPEMSDLQLIVGDNVFHTHKLILSISSDVLKTMLTSPTWPESYKDEVVLQEDPECEEVFADFLHYLYTGRIHMSHLTVLPILSLADKYNIGDLTSLCIDYMCSHCVASKCTSRVLSWYTYATMCGHKTLEHVCEEYILWNFQYVVETDDFLSLSPEILMHFICSSDIVVKSELSLYLAVKRWITKKMTIQDSTECFTSINSAIKSVLKCIKFTLMTYSELTSLQDDSLVEKFPDLLQTPIKAALEFHIAQRSLAHQRDTNTHSHQTNGSSNPEHSKPCDKFYCEDGMGEEALASNSSEIGNSQSDKLTYMTNHAGSESHSDVDKCQGSALSRIPTSFTELSALAKLECPRIYTCDSWCTEMVISDLGEIAPGDVLGAFFSTPITGCEEDESCFWDWHIDLYPKGIAFKKCMMIGMLENREIDEVLYETVRLTVTSNTSETRKVKISVMVIGEEEGLEYVVKGLTKTCIFDEDCVLYNISDIIPFAELHGDTPTYRIGERKDMLKVTVVIRPTLT